MVTKEDRIFEISIRPGRNSLGKVKYHVLVPSPIGGRVVMTFIAI